MFTIRGSWIKVQSLIICLFFFLLFAPTHKPLSDLHIHTLNVFSECAWNFTEPLLGGEVASQSKFINVWNISSLIFAPVHSSDFAWWWCIIKCWNNTTISAYELLFLFFSHSKTADFNWLGLIRNCHKWTFGYPHAIVYNSLHHLIKQHKKSHSAIYLIVWTLGKVISAPDKQFAPCKVFTATLAMQRLTLISFIKRCVFCRGRMCEFSLLVLWNLKRWWIGCSSFQKYWVYKKKEHLKVTVKGNGKSCAALTKQRIEARLAKSRQMLDVDQWAVTLMTHWPIASRFPLSPHLVGGASGWLSRKTANFYILVGIHWWVAFVVQDIFPDYNSIFQKKQKNKARTVWALSFKNPEQTDVGVVGT